MAKRNSVSAQAFLSVSGVRKREGIIIALTEGSITFESRKPGGSNRLVEIISTSKVLAAFGNKGKEGCVLYTYEPTDIFGKKKRNTLVMENPSDYGQHLMIGTAEGFDTVLVNKEQTHLVTEVKVEGGRGKKGSGEKASKKKKKED